MKIWAENIANISNVGIHVYVCPYMYVLSNIAIFFGFIQVGLKCKTSLTAQFHSRVFSWVRGRVHSSTITFSAKILPCERFQTRKSWGKFAGMFNSHSAK